MKAAAAVVLSLWSAATSAQASTIPVTAILATNCGAPRAEALATYDLELVQPPEIAFLMHSGGTLTPIGAEVDGQQFAASNNAVAVSKSGQYSISSGLTNGSVHIRLVMSPNSLCLKRHSISLIYQLKSELVGHLIELPIGIEAGSSNEVRLTADGRAELTAIVDEAYGKRIAFYLETPFAWISDAADDGTPRSFCFRCAPGEKLQLKLQLARFLDAIPTQFINPNTASPFLAWPGAIQFVDAQRLRFATSANTFVDFVQCTASVCGSVSLHLGAVNIEGRDTSRSIARLERSTCHQSDVNDDVARLLKPRKGFGAPSTSAPRTEIFGPC